MHSLTQYKDQVRVELTGDILPFYMRIGIDKEQDGFPISREKAGLWKSPYHNGRDCLEIMRRIEQIHEPNPKSHQS